MIPAVEKKRFPWIFAVGGALVAALVAGAILLRKPDFERGVLEFKGEAMGSTYNIKIVDPSLHAGTREALDRGIAGELDLVDSTMSRFNPESELSRFNQSRDGRPFIMSDAAIDVIAAALKMSAKSGGAYDITVLPLLRLWGFASRSQRKAMPSQAEIDAARAHVGWRSIGVNEKEHTLRKIDPEVEIDLGSIAPGAAVDRLAEMFEAFDYRNYMVELSGEVRAHGRRPDGAPWRIGVEKPLDDRHAIKEIVALNNRAMSTSGDYRQFYLLDGKRLSHTIDPRTGRPIEHGLASITVIHDDCMTADAWATALDVLGPVEGFDLAQREGIAALFITRGADGAFSERATSGFEALRRQTAAGKPAE
jgi:FAD:protein FMN transferase